MTPMRVAVTGSEGLIGAALCEALAAQGHHVRRLDLALPADHEAHGDVADAVRVRALVEGCDGVVHLAAVSRVVHAERDPARCERTNVQGTACVVDAALASPARPWVLFASSREVYGEPARLPVREDDPIAPMNHYGRSKAAGEAIVARGRASGLATAVLRFANVYGALNDHADRVLPAFCRGAARGEDLRVDGPMHTFDFTHVSDVVQGALAAVARLASGDRAVPTIHLASGRPTTLGQLAVMAAAAGGWRSEVKLAPARSFDVSRFCGDPTRAKVELGWSARVSIEAGLDALVRAYAHP